MAIAVRFDNIGIDFAALTNKYKDRFATIGTPAFEAHKEDIRVLQEQLANYADYQNILIVGNGGSIWSFMPFYTALANRVDGKNVVLLTDMEPDYLSVLQKKYTPEDSLVVVISKSGSTVGVIENLFAFADYKQLYVTDTESTLGKIGQERGIEIITHPPVGGRYSSFTSCAYVPALLVDLPVEDLEIGGRGGYDLYRDFNNSENPALQVALALYELENQDYTEVFLPIYSNFLQTFGMIVTQLFHESFGKDGKGLTVVAAQAPESQHHTNQRFFGGRKNMVGCFLHVEQQNSAMTISIPEELELLTLRNGTLGDIQGINLARSFDSEYLGTYTDAKEQQIPLIDVVVSRVNGKTVGELMAFWHYVTVYSAVLRSVDPFDQPQVENSKVISFKQRQQSQ